MDGGGEYLSPCEHTCFLEGVDGLHSDSALENASTNCKLELIARGSGSLHFTMRLRITVFTVEITPPIESFRRVIQSQTVNLSATG